MFLDPLLCKAIASSLYFVECGDSLPFSGSCGDESPHSTYSGWMGQAQFSKSE